MTTPQLTWGEMLASMRVSFVPGGTADVVALRTYKTIWWSTADAQALVDEIEQAAIRCKVEGSKLSKLETLALQVLRQSAHLE